LDIGGTAAALRDLARDRDAARAVGQQCLLRAHSQPTWDAIGAQFAARIDAACITAASAPTPIPLGDIRSARRGNLESELLLRDKLILLKD
jgi:hypothetical protein